MLWFGDRVKWTFWAPSRCLASISEAFANFEQFLAFYFCVFDSNTSFGGALCSAGGYRKRFLCS